MLFDKVTADAFKLGHIQEKSLYRKKQIDGVLSIDNRHRGNIQVRRCNTKHLRSETAAKWTARQLIGNCDVPSAILTNSA